MFFLILLFYYHIINVHCLNFRCYCISYLVNFLLEPCIANILLLGVNLHTFATSSPCSICMMASSVHVQKALQVLCRSLSVVCNEWRHQVTTCADLHNNPNLLLTLPINNKHCMYRGHHTCGGIDYYEHWPPSPTHITQTHTTTQTQHIQTHTYTQVNCTIKFAHCYPS